MSEPVLEGLSPEEMRQVVILGQMILKLAHGQPIGRMMNASLWIMFTLAAQEVEIARGCVQPLRGLADTMERMAHMATLMGTPDPEPGTPLH